MPAINGGSSTSPSWVYALGNIEARFPSVSVEREFAQATGREKTSGLTDRQALHTVLSKPENRYLVRQCCFVMTVEGLETYILTPRDPADLVLLVEAVRPNPSPMDLDVVIGMKGPIAPPQVCNGLMVPIVVFDQIYSFDRDALIKAIPKPEKTSAKEFAPAAEELFDRIMQLTDNAGSTDEHRALNYLAVRYQAIYAESCRRIRPELFAHRSRRSGFASQRRAQRAGRDLLLHQSQHRCGGQVLCARGRDRRVPVPGDQAVTVLRPVNLRWTAVVVLQAINMIKEGMR